MIIEHKLPDYHDTMRVIDQSEDMGFPWLTIELRNEHYEEKTIENCTIFLQDEEIQQLLQICIKALNSA
jgi:hypothetical protein